MERLVLKPYTRGGAVSFRDFMGMLRRSRGIALVTGDYGCRECDVLKELLRESGAEGLIDYELVVTHDDDSVEEAVSNGIMGIPLIIDCRGGDCSFINHPDPYRQFEELVRRLEEHGRRPTRR